MNGSGRFIENLVYFFFLGRGGGSGILESEIHCKC